MFCPRCGAESDEGSRYCASCGAELPRETRIDAEGKDGDLTVAGRLERLIGSDRRTRLVTLGTGLAILIAIVAFLALKASDGGGPELPQDGYARAVDAACVQHKREIARAQEKALAGGGSATVSRYADAIVPIVGDWRLELKRGIAPANRAGLVPPLEAALLEVEIEAGTLARVARESDSREITKVAAQVDAATANVEAAVDSLDLERCGQLAIAGGQLVRQ